MLHDAVKEIAQLAQLAPRSRELRHKMSACFRVRYWPKCSRFDD